MKRVSGWFLVALLMETACFLKRRGPSPLLTAGHLLLHGAQRVLTHDGMEHVEGENVFVICSPSSASLPPSLLHLSAHAIILTHWVFVRDSLGGGDGRGGGMMLEESEPGPPR